MNQLQPRLVWSLERQARVLASIHAAEERAARRRFAVLLGLAFTFCAVATYIAGGAQ